MRIKKTDPALAEMDVTPMIDIVFQLIAFFMVITNFDQTQADERVKLPRDVLAKPPEVKRDDQLVLNVGFERDKDGNKLDPDPFVFWSERMIRVLDFGRTLQTEARLAKQRGQDPKDFTIVIRADADVPTGLVQELIRLAQEAEYEKFSLSATQKSE